MTQTHPHATLVKFGYPDTLVHEGEHWAVLVRPQQPTLGSLVLCSTSDATAYGDLPAAAFVEQGQLVARIEAMLAKAVDYQRINYLMLMMVDPHVHFHVIPRYKGERTFGEVIHSDSGWPGPPNLGDTRPAGPELIVFLKNNFN
jgi:diadenosine tetraphosphate (Ap4A) HIT family hydrolase